MTDDTVTETDLRILAMSMALKQHAHHTVSDTALAKSADSIFKSISRNIRWTRS